MEFKYGKISEKRCKEIDEMDIRCPYPYDGGQTKFTAEGEYFVYNEDESILFCTGFMPIPAEVYYCNDVYILFINNKYIYIYIYMIRCGEHREEKGISYYHYYHEIRFYDDIEKMNNKGEILHLLKQMIPIEYKAFKDDVVYEVDLFYNGEEVK